MIADEIVDELAKYSAVEVDGEGEIGVFESSIMSNVIRKRELEIILDNISPHGPKLILDYGCGGGWLSSFLCDKGFMLVGTDVNTKLVRKAKSICPKAEFVICDAERLPFRESAFEAVVGVSILHHLDLVASCCELKRVLNQNARFTFLEPNSLNPLSAVGRKLFPTEVHTRGERPFVPSIFENVLSQNGFVSETSFTLFFISFVFARLCKVVEVSPLSFTIKLISLLESMLENVPGMNQLNSTIVAAGTIQK